LIFIHSFFVTQVVYTASLTVAYLYKLFSSNCCLKSLRISAVGDIKKQVIPRVLT